MSIYGTTIYYADDEHPESCGVWEQEEFEGCFAATGECDCGRIEQPLIYQGSHVLPSDEDDRGGGFDLAEIPSHITRDGRHDRGEDGAPWPWLRVGMWQDKRTYGDKEFQHATVILTRRQIAEIHDYLGDWLERSEDDPANPASDTRAPKQDLLP